jgi:hypothetical protein
LATTILGTKRDARQNGESAACRPIAGNSVPARVCGLEAADTTAPRLLTPGLCSFDLREFGSPSGTLAKIVFGSPSGTLAKIVLQKWARRVTHYPLTTCSDSSQLQVLAKMEKTAHRRGVLDPRRFFRYDCCGISDIQWRPPSNLCSPPDSG